MAPVSLCRPFARPVTTFGSSALEAQHLRTYICGALPAVAPLGQLSSRCARKAGARTHRAVGLLAGSAPLPLRPFALPHGGAAAAALSFSRSLSSGPRGAVHPPAFPAGGMFGRRPSSQVRSSRGGGPAGSAQPAAEAEEGRAASTPPASGEGATAGAEVATTEAGGFGANGAAAEGGEEYPTGVLEFQELRGWGLFKARWRMLFCWPWQRVKKGSVLAMKLSGPIGEQLSGSPFARGLTLPQVCDNLRKAALDPRVSALVLKLEPLACGWAKVEEIRRHVEFFRKSGKPCIAYMVTGGEKEYYLAAACSELYTPPGAYVSIRGLAVTGSFLGGVLEKAGVQPQIQRIGKYKSAGDQLARKEMSEPVREMLTAILDDIFGLWKSGVASAVGKGEGDVDTLLDEGVIQMEQLQGGGWITGILYEDQVEDLLKAKIGANPKKKLRAVNYRKYSRVNAKTFGLTGAGDRIAVIRAVGAISRGGSTTGGGVSSERIIELVRQVKDNKKFKALVLRIDSPGGDALASDLMWHEIRLLAKEKPVIASMSDVAASGGYYMAMGATAVVSEALTLTGSIGVVTGKFNLRDLYQRVGFTKEFLSRGKYAELDADNRPFNPEEEKYFAKGAQIAYKSFRDKAALSRGLPVEEMEKFAQGRVWTGAAALPRKLVDAIGGLSRAVAIAKQKAGIPQEKPVTLVELSRQQPSPLALLTSGAQLFTLLAGWQGPEGRAAAAATAARSLLPEGLDALLGSEGPQAIMDDIRIVDGVGRDQSAAAAGERLAPLLLLQRLFPSK